MKSNLTTAKAMFIACISILVFTHQLSAQTYKLVGTGRYEGGSVYGLDANGNNPEMLRKILKHPPTQLYITLPAPDEETFIEMCKPSKKDAWKNL